MRYFISISLYILIGLKLTVSIPSEFNSDSNSTDVVVDNSTSIDITTLPTTSLGTTITLTTTTTTTSTTTVKTMTLDSTTITTTTTTAQNGRNETRMTSLKQPVRYQVKSWSNRLSSNSIFNVFSVLLLLSIKFIH